MKTKSIIVAGLVFLFSTAFIAGNAQSNPTIKVLPSKTEGSVKLIVVGAEKAVDVKFYNEDGFVYNDDVKTDAAGFNKKYNLKSMMKSDIWMEITADGTSVTYQLASADDKLTPFLVKTTYTYPVVASNQ